MIWSIARNLLGKAANLFPNHVFYHRDFMRSYMKELGDGNEAEGHRRVVLCFVAVADRFMREANATEIEIHLTSATSGGSDTGSFRVFVEKIPAAPEGE